MMKLRPEGSVGWKAAIVPRARNVHVLAGSGAACAVAYVLLIHWLGQDYNLKSLTLLGAFAIATLGLALLLGITWQFSLAHAFFFALGAYGYAILGGAEYRWSPQSAAATAILGGAVLAYVVGRVLLRLEGFYFAVATLGLTLIGENLLFVMRSYTGGDDGLPAPQLEVVGYAFDTPLRRYVIVSVVLAVGFAFAVNISRSAFGRSARAVAADELMAGSNGIPVVSIKTRMFVISTVYATTGGVLYASASGYIFPTLSGLTTTLEFVVAVIVGGMGSLLGPVLVVAVIRWLPIVFEPLEGHVDLAYGSLLIILLMVADGSGKRTGFLQGLKRRPSLRKRLHEEQSTPQSRPGGVQ
ncbi:MAG: branched-chain amino acid ABC transporter permease [Roseovarius sp.]|jgi:branched-chain amino acid transport system permease protein|nr:branched-chain amino acid ABC transporter permease [Roseovarius sp.]